MTSLMKAERLGLQRMGRVVLGKVGQLGDGTGDEWFESITFQARKPVTDEEIGLSAWEPGGVVHGSD